MAFNGHYCHGISRMIKRSKSVEMLKDERYHYVIPHTLTQNFEITPDDLLTGLKQTTSSHGIPHVARARGQ